MVVVNQRNGVSHHQNQTPPTFIYSHKFIRSEAGTNFHDTEKPVALWGILIANSSQENEVVLDPFMGIGGSAVSAKKLKRSYIGCEIDPTYFEVAESRVNNSVLPDKGFKTKRLF